MCIGAKVLEKDNLCQPKKFSHGVYVICACSLLRTLLAKVPCVGAKVCLQGGDARKAREKKYNILSTESRNGNKETRKVFLVYFYIFKIEKRNAESLFTRIFA